MSVGTWYPEVRGMLCERVLRDWRQGVGETK